MPGTFTYTPAAATVLAFGANQNLHVDFAPTDADNYDNASKDVKINVNKAHLTVTADDKSKTYDGSAFTAFTAKVSGFVNGDNSSVVSGSADFTGNAAGNVDPIYSELRAAQAALADGAGDAGLGRDDADAK